MSLSYLFDPNLQVQDKSGNNNVNGFLRVYIDNTDDRAVTYKDFNGTFNQADIRLDNNGRAVVIVDDTMTYRLEVYDRDGAMLWTQYPVKPSNTVINYGINNTYVMNADVRGTPDEIDVASTTDQQTGFKTFFIKLSSTVKDFLSFVSNTLTSHGDAIGNLQTTVSSQGTTIESLQNGKKDKQQQKTFNGSATKTVKKVTQNENGEVTVEYEDIDLPPEVPKVEITSPNGTIDVHSSTNVQTNTKTFEIDVANGGNSCGWFNSSNIDTVGNEESINVDRFRISEGQSVIGNGLEFVPNSGDVESGVPFGKVYANAGIYFVSAQLNVSWTGNPVNKICNVGGRQFDFSYNHEERIVTTNLARFSSRTKMSVSISLESDIPAGLRIWVDRFQIFAINAGTLEGGSVTPYTAGDGIDITDNNISVMFSKGLELNSDGKLQAKVGNGIYCTADGQLTTSEPEGNFIDITNEWEFDNGFRLQYNGVIPGNDNDMRILYSPVSDTVKFTSACRINKTSSISSDWNVMLRYIGARFYTTHNAPTVDLAPNIGYTPTLGGVHTTIGTDANGTSSRAMLKIAYVGSRETAESLTGLAIRRFFDDGSTIFGCMLQNLVLKVHKRI